MHETRYHNPRSVEDAQRTFKETKVLHQQGIDEAATGEQHLPAVGSHDDGREQWGNQQENYEPAPAPSMTHKVIGDRIADQRADQRDDAGEDERVRDTLQIEAVR